MKWTQALQGIRNRGEIAVIPTDTMYGIVGSALDRKAVEKIYKVRKRTPSKPLIILIDSHARLADFGITLSSDRLKALLKMWPDKITVILPCKSPKFKYLHRGTNKLAFRMPKNTRLLKILRETGPLVAPSANPEGENPAKTLKEAQDYFGAGVDFYIDGGRMKDVPSTIIEILGMSGRPKVSLIREGAVKANSKKLKKLLY